MGYGVSQRSILEGLGCQLYYDGNRSPVSGNCDYDVYGVHVVTINGNLFASPTIMNVSGVRTSAPVPRKEDFHNIKVEDAGLIISNRNMQKVTFRFMQPYNFHNTSQFGAGYPSIAASGLIRISCSGTHPTERTWYESNGTSSDNEWHDYIALTSNSGVWTLPKYVRSQTTMDNSSSVIPAADYQGYKFYVNFVNSSGVISPYSTVSFTSENMKKYHIGSILDADTASRSTDKFKEHSVLNPVNVEGITHRKRLGIGIHDIDIQSIKYKKEGVYISERFGNETPIYAVSMSASEQFPGIQSLSFKKWDFIKHYIQFGNSDSEEWHRISPTQRKNEIDEVGNNVPSVIILDALIDQGKTVTKSDTYGYISHVNLNKSIYNFRMKIEINTNASDNAGNWSPYIYDYKVTVLDRNVLRSSLSENYLFL
jgi:hypothetical protein